MITEDRPAALPTTGVIAPDGRAFPWGPIVKIHTIGTIKIVEYQVDRSSSFQEQYWADHGATRYSVFVDDHSTSHSFHSLDSAVVYGIAHKRVELNDARYVAAHFDRMTNHEER